MEHQEFEPPELLQDTIRCIWYNSRDFGGTSSDFEVVPDGYAEIIFHVGSGCDIFYNGIWQPLPSPFIMGLLNQPVLIRAHYRLQIIGVRCFPWTVFDLLQLPAAKAAVHILQHPISTLQPVIDHCIRAGRIVEAVAQVNEYLLSARAQLATNTMLFRAGDAMRKAKGNLPVGNIAAAAHVTVRTLERQFKRSSGYSVKDVSGLMRFEQVRNKLWQFPETSIAGTAQEFGYADQSHLSREFKRYSGTSPAAFARKAKHRKLSFGTDFVVFVQA